MLGDLYRQKINQAENGPLFVGEDKKVVPTKTPPGLSTRLISAICFFQQRQGIYHDDE
jgi:hypothetical protein